ncbi:hypothetical protein HK102_014134 [Quaeritorhiza haematococci]|nr:hypothetical protein HK102_014134 [Quaeritorhiza haematococci]
MNTPNLLLIEDRPNSTGAWQFPNPYEQDDAIKSIFGMGGRVTRTYTLGIGPAYHVIGVRRYNEHAFRAMDHAIASAARYGVRLIIPLFNNGTDPKGYGTYAGFAALRGKRPQAFWEDREVIEDFKHLVSYVLCRVNTVTGVAYRDDPAVLCWQLGNEYGSWEDAPPPASWTLEIAAHIKNVDPNHLVMDGMIAGHHQRRWPKDVLSSPLIDIITNHYYWGEDDVSSGRLAADAKFVRKRYGKAFIAGEFGFSNVKVYKKFLKIALKEGISGTMIWSLRFHSCLGGFYIHDEGNNYAAYHVPGFPPDHPGFIPEERDVVSLFREYAFLIHPSKPSSSSSPLLIPDAPVILPKSTVNDLKWMGSAWASAYEIWRKDDVREGELAGVGGDGEVGMSEQGWRVVAKDVTDAKPTGTGALWGDGTGGIQRGRLYAYRMRAYNSAGTSGFSNVIVLRA